MIYFAYAMAWISTAIGAVAGLYFTQSPWCLLVFYFPASLAIKNHTKDDEKEDNDGDNA